MSAAVDRLAVPLEHYLTTSYRPDCEYLDGELLERNVGEWDHGRLQGMLLLQLARYQPLGILAAPEIRVQVKPTRFRVPDVCAVIGRPSEQILRSPPFLCIEILSRDDRMSEMQERIDDYLGFGVPYVWVLDPRLKHGYVFTADGIEQVKEALETREPAIRIPLAELFSGT